MRFGSSGDCACIPLLAGRLTPRLRGARLFVDGGELSRGQVGLRRMCRFLLPEFRVAEFIQSVTRLSDAAAQTGSVRCRSTDVWCHGSVHSMSIWYRSRNSVVKRRFTWIPACFNPLTATSRRLRSGSVKSFQIQCLGDSLSCGSAPRFSCVRVRQQAPRPGQCSQASANISRAPKTGRSTRRIESFSPTTKMQERNWAHGGQIRHMPCTSTGPKALPKGFGKARWGERHDE